MSALVTEAIVLHAFNYLESSRIFRLATRDGGVRSVLARGARSSRKRFGTALDLFAEGIAQIQTKPGRDLDTLTSFDVVKARSALASDLARFTGASAFAELTLRFAHGEADPALFDAVRDGLDAIEHAEPSHAREATLAAAWRVVGELGLAPSLEACSECHQDLSPNDTVRFSHPAGGALCERCGRLAAASRSLPPEARLALGHWLRGERVTGVTGLELRAHQRLLREFLREHLTDGRPMHAFEVWEHDGWSAA
jgi:DNA repair protein RecO (recombination protein O)